MPFRGKEGPGSAEIALDHIGRELLEHLGKGSAGVSIAVDVSLVQGVIHGASDIYFEPWADCLALRYRIDGSVYDICQIPKDYQSGIISCIKVLAQMPPYKRDLPQDARIEADTMGEGRALRVATFPTVHGEKVVVRVSENRVPTLTLDRLGFHGRIAKGLREVIARPEGTLLFTGPSGSGKTTTIYAILRELTGTAKRRACDTGPHVVTIEDPVEYQLDYASQTEINTAAGLSYDVALRSVLRLAPDVIVIGEIRDHETAHALIQAGLTGHFLISTIHSGTAVGVFTRLLDMGLEPYLVASSVTAVLAQRLVRRNCPACSAPYTPHETLVEEFGFDRGTTFLRGTGCEACQGLGFHGRTALGEMLTMQEDLANLILRRPRTSVLHAAAMQIGMMPLVDHGVKKVKRGATTVEELSRALLPRHTKAKVSSDDQGREAGDGAT